MVGAGRVRAGEGMGGGGKGQGQISQCGSCASRCASNGASRGASRSHLRRLLFQSSTAIIAADANAAAAAAIGRHCATTATAGAFDLTWARRAWRRRKRRVGSRVSGGGGGSGSGGGGGGGGGATHGGGAASDRVLSREWRVWSLDEQGAEQPLGACGGRDELSKAILTRRVEVEESEPLAPWLDVEIELTIPAGDALV